MVSGEIAKNLYNSAYDFEDGIHSAINLNPLGWTKFTVTDGNAMTEDTLSALHYRDYYLANSIEKIEKTLFEKYKARIWY